MKISEETKFTIQGWAFIVGYVAFIAMLAWASAHDRQMWRERFHAATEVANVH